MVKKSRVIITNLRVPNVWHSCISESYIRHALLIHKLCALSGLWSLSYFCVKFQYICIVVQMNVLWVFYNGCSPRGSVVFMHIWTSDAPWRSNCSLIPSSSNHLQIDAFRQIYNVFAVYFICMFFLMDKNSRYSVSPVQRDRFSEWSFGICCPVGMAGSLI